MSPQQEYLTLSIMSDFPLIGSCKSNSSENLNAQPKPQLHQPSWVSLQWLLLGLGAPGNGRRNLFTSLVLEWMPLSSNTCHFLSILISSCTSFAHLLSPQWPPWNTPETALLWALALPVFSAWEVLLPSPSSLCSLQDRSLNLRTGVETRNMTVFRKPSDGEDGRLMSQNNHLKGIWTPVCFIEQRWGEVGLPRWHRW